MRQFLGRRSFALISVGMFVLMNAHVAQAGEPFQEFIDTVQSRLQAKIVPGQYIVVLKNSTDPDQVVNEHGILKNYIYKDALRGFASALTDKQLEKLKKDPRVDYIEPDQIVTAFAQTIPTGVTRINGKNSPTAKINGTDERVNVDIAIIDTGVQKGHSDLNVYKQVNFVSSFFDRTVDDLNGHGTHVAGTAAALDNGIGVVGVAPGARIWSVRVLDRNGSGYMSDIIAGINYVTQNAKEIEVANMSLGCSCTDAGLTTAINNSVAAGVVYVVAAGNSGKDATTFSPANNPNVITVSAIADFNGASGGGAKSTCYKEIDDTFADFSNFGAPVDIAAPGVCIYSTWKGNSYNTISGTSMASPHVAGAVALYLATHPKPTNTTGVTSVRNAITGSGSLQTGSGGFIGDPDAAKENLLNVTNF